MKKTSIRHWITSCFIGILILSVVLSAATNLYQAYVDIMKQDAEWVDLCAQEVSNLLDRRSDALREKGASELYEEAHATLRQICRNFELEYLYIYTVDEDVPCRHYLLCISGDADKDSDAREIVKRSRPADRLTPGEQALLSGEREIRQEGSDDPLVDAVTWIAPYYDSEGELRALIGMDYSVAQFKREVLEDFLNEMIPFVLTLVLGMLLLLFLVQRRIIAPISALSDSMKIFAHDSRNKPEPLNIRSGDEIGEIADSFEKMTEDISSYINNIESLTRERLEGKMELEIARRIQYGLVPENTRLDDGSFSIYAMTKPAREVGGDFYDCSRPDESSVFVVIGDVSGKGISAAICMAMLKTIIREKLIAGLSPAEALNQTNEEFMGQNPENLFATAFVAILDLHTGRLRYANAGHTYPVLLDEKPELLIPESGIAIGMFEDADIQDRTMTLSAGHGILLYTDGVTETVDAQKRFFGTERLLDALSGADSGADSAEETVLRVSRAVSDFRGDAEKFDDTAVMALIYRGNAPRALPVALSAFDEIKRDVIAAAGETPETRRALLACDEALANIVSYSGAKTLCFGCEKKGGVLRVTFTDDGTAFDPTAAESGEKEFDMLDSGGMGLDLIRQSAASMQYERKDGQNIFTVFFTLQDPSGGTGTT